MSSMNIESGVEEEKQTPKPAKKAINLPLTLLNCFLLTIGVIGGPLLIRLYYLHGGKRRWLTTCMQTAGFPILLFPFVFLLLRSQAQQVPLSVFLMEPKLVVFSGVTGVFTGLADFLYSLGISYLPVSTSAIVYSTQLIFIAFLAWLIVKQKFTSYSINSVVLMILGSVILGIGSNGDKLKGESTGQYFYGLFLTLGSSALSGLVLPCIEFSYTKSTRPVNYSTVLQFQINLAIFATIFSIIGMLINKDFQAIGREADEYGLGHGMYYVVLFASAVVWQLSFIGVLGIIFCVSSLFSGIITAVILPITEIASVIAYHESFNGEKGLSLALCLWGFISYFYGEYKMNKKKSVEEQWLILVLGYRFLLKRNFSKRSIL